MPTTIQMPTAVFILIIGFSLYILLRDDLPRKRKKNIRSYRKRFIAKDMNEYVDSLMELERRQHDLYEMN